jgi:hypothetical protein
MFWLLKKIFGIGVLVAVVFLALQYSVGGRPLKDYVIDLYKAPIFQEAVRQGKEFAFKYLGKYRSGQDGPALDKVDDEDRRELEKVLKKAR